MQDVADCLVFRQEFSSTNAGLEAANRILSEAISQFDRLQILHVDRHMVDQPPELYVGRGHFSGAALDSQLSALLALANSQPSAAPSSVPTVLPTGAPSTFAPSSAGATLAPSRAPATAGPSSTLSQAPSGAPSGVKISAPTSDEAEGQRKDPTSSMLPIGTTSRWVQRFGKDSQQLGEQHVSSTLHCNACQPIEYSHLSNNTVFNA